MRFKIFVFLFLVSYAAISNGQVNATLNLDTCRIFKDLEAALQSPDKVYKLQLQKMKLKEFPIEILKFRQLRVLDLRKNKLSSIPLEISELKYLEEVNFSKNKIVEFPEGLTKCSQLKEIVLSQNELDSLPASIGKLKQLERLDLWSNNLGFYPAELKDLVQLKELVLRVINMNKQQQQRIRRLLPNTQIHFSPSCDCAN